MGLQTSVANGLDCAKHAMKDLTLRDFVRKWRRRLMKYDRSP